MILREVTIGRSKNCDIYLDERCAYASKTHGTIYFDGNQLMYRDTSTNGTLVNNINIKHRAVPINHGDLILIAGKYPLSWNQIDEYFPPTAQQPFSPEITPSISTQPSSTVQPILSSWNWGAFGLSGLWGLFNGCWWLFLINMCLGMLMAIPFVNIIALLAGLGVQILCGLKGTQWAWTYRTWKSVQDFQTTQKNWSIAGIIVFCLQVISYIVILSTPLYILF